MPTFKDRHGAVLLRFGYGDIVVGHADDQDGSPRGLFLSQCDPHPIGEPLADVPPGTRVGDLDLAVLMEFDALESLDVLLDRLQALRGRMADRELEVRRDTVRKLAAELGVPVEFP